MPADENVASLLPRMISPSQNTPESSYSQVTEKYGLQLPNGLQKQPFVDSCLNHPTRPTEKTAVFQPSSGPVESCPLTDEYVIITKSDPQDRSEPQNIPRMGLVLRPVNRGMERSWPVSEEGGVRVSILELKWGQTLHIENFFHRINVHVPRKAQLVYYVHINLRYRAMKTMIFPGSGPTLPTVA